MANEFLDNAILKAKEFFEVAAKKTEEVVDTEKLKYNLSVIKNSREKDFAALGRAYYNAVKNDSIDKIDEQDLITRIEEKTDSIKVLKEEISAAKNKKLCNSCGCLVTTDSLYCKKCGGKL